MVARRAACHLVFGVVVTTAGEPIVCENLLNRWPSVHIRRKHANQKRPDNLAHEFGDAENASDNFPVQVTVILPAERKAAAQKGIEQHPHGPDICTEAGILLPGNNLWGHIRGRPAENLQFLPWWHDCGETEVNDLHSACLVQEQVLQFDVAVHYVPIMHVPDALRDLEEELPCCMVVHPPPRSFLQKVVERPARQIIHDQIDLL
mmetsp:Transcript_45313/g.89731  ORF Transcript_45313/g.89731 Transcript_45313/m.89731 type:complete len:205 (+) Transcript_45313:646-1260(+)